MLLNREYTVSNESSPKTMSKLATREIAPNTSPTRLELELNA